MKFRERQTAYYAAMSNGVRVLIKHYRHVKLHPKFDFIVHPSVDRAGSWTVTDAASGLAVSMGPTPEEAIAEARRVLERHVHASGELAPQLKKIRSERFQTLSA